MPGVGKRQGMFHGFPVANFADQHHVRCLTQGVFQGCMETAGVDTDFPLIDDGFLVPMDILHRVLDGDDVAAAVAIAVIDQRRQGGRLARACGADEQHQPLFLHDGVQKHPRQFQVFEARNVQLDVAYHHGHVIALLEDIDPEPPDASQGDRQVHFQLPIELKTLFGVHERLGEPGNVTDLERLVPQGLDHALETRARWRTRGHVKVGTILARQDSQQRIDFHGLKLPRDVNETS